MTTKPKKKLCWNCEGRVTLEEENCPYCGVYLSPSSTSDLSDPKSLMPSYRVEENEELDVLPPPPYEQKQAIDTEADTLTESSAADLRGFLIPLSLLLSGSVFFLFGLVLLLFSKNGVFTLTWTSTFWYIYFGFGVAMLLFGWRSLHQLEEN